MPAPGPGEARARVECCTVCGSDLHTIRGARTEPAPSILGHEIIGVIDSTGDPAPCDIDGQPLQPGDRVTWSVAVSCGDCDRCRSGWPQKCRTLFKYGHSLAEGPYALSGGLSEFIVFRGGSTVVRIPRDFPAAVICPANCATATIAAGFRAAGAVQDRRVLILGAGMLGVTAAAFADDAGAATVVVSDPDAKRLAVTDRFGGPACVEPDSDPDEFRDRLRAASGSATFDVILEISGAPSAVSTAIAVGDIGARIVLIGSVLPSPDVPIDPESIVRRCLSISGVHNYAPQDLRTAVDFLQRTHSKYPFAELVEQTFALDEVNAAVDWANRERPLRVAVQP